MQQPATGIGFAAAMRLAAALAAGCALPSAAAAGEARAVLSVTAEVLPACSVAQRPAQRHAADVACSAGARVSTMTTAYGDEQPLREAAAILGTPVLRGGQVRLTAPVAPAAATAAAVENGARYLTVTY